MGGRLFLIHWNASEAGELAKPLRATGWQVTIEAEDGAREDMDTRLGIMAYICYNGCNFRSG